MDVVLSVPLGPDPGDGVVEVYADAAAHANDHGFAVHGRQALLEVLHEVLGDPGNASPRCVGIQADGLNPCACDFLSYIRILTHHEEFLIVHLRPELVGADAPHSILCEAQVGGLVTLQTVERLAQHLLGHLDPLSEGGRSAFVRVAEGQDEFAVCAADDGQG
jgi:hypothetical protein